MKRPLVLLLLALSAACTRQEYLEEIDEPEPLYTQIRETFDRKADSISQLSCLGELTFDGGGKVYFTIEQDSAFGVAHFYSPTRQELGWVRYGEGPPVWSFEDVPEIGGLLESGLFTGLTAVGHPHFPTEVEHLKIGEGQKSLSIRFVHGGISYGYRILKRPLALLTLTVDTEESSIDVEFRNHRQKGSLFFPYRLLGSTSFGDFELVYLEIKPTVTTVP